MWDTVYRPLVFGDVLGQGGSVQVLRARLVKGKAFDSSYIFAGGHGSGKTTLARILARAMLCLAPLPDGDPCNTCDHCLACLNETMGAFTEFDAASQGTTADMRRLVDHLAYDIPGIQKRIYLLDEAHRMSRDAQDVLLKPIEDKRVVVLFCTTEYGKIRDTIASRCEVHEIRKIPREAILQRVQGILRKEGVESQEEALLTVIDHAGGHVRDVLNRLETIAQLGAITVETVRERLDLSAVPLFYDILLALGDPRVSIALIEAACGRLNAPLVATGLAEAAMSAFRHAQGIHTDATQLDRQRAELVYARFGTSTPAVARYFLGLGAYVTGLDLVCAAVAFKSGGSVPTPVAAVAEVASPPVVFLAPAPVQVLAPPVEAAPPVNTQTPSEVKVPTAAPAAPRRLALVPPPTPASTSYVDGNVPTCDEDACKMVMPDQRPKGLGPSNPGYAPVKPPRERGVEVPGFGREEFTTAFHEILESVAAHGK